VVAKIVCAVCGEEPSDPDEAEPTADGKWMHQKCMKKSYSLNFLDWIKMRIAVTRTEDEDRSKFVIRELVQNADDADATILVMRFEKDALYVANDGRAFSTVGPGGAYEGSDFDRSSRVLKRFKEYDKESTGHFGSGFQTVYALTNRPEVHSNLASRALNPLNMGWDDLDTHLHSPYAGGPVGRKGVLFRLPWRDDAAAKLVVGEAGERPFADKDFPRWNPDEIRSFYEDLKGYLGDVLLCCQRLKAIRIIWSADNRPEAYQAERDYALNDPLPKPSIVEVRLGQAGEGGGWYRWDPHKPVEGGTCPSSFDIEDWKYQTPEIRKYLAASSLIKNKERRRLLLLRGKRGSVRVDTSSGPGDVEIKKNHVHVLFPLFPARRAYLYSVIPLPSRGRNTFAFSAHLVPTENRMGVDIQGNDLVNGEWYRDVMLSLVVLYQDTFPEFLEAVKQIGLVQADAQSIVLQSLPVGEVREWMRQGAEDTQWGNEEGKGLRDWLFAQPIMVTNDGAWQRPSESFFVSNEVERKVVQVLGLVAMPASFTAKFGDIPWLQARSESLRFSEAEFVKAWSRLSEAAPLHYGGTAGPRKSERLDRAAVDSVLRYALSITVSEQVSALPLIPDATGEFRSLASYPKPPPELKEVLAIFSPKRRIHRDFEGVVAELEKAKSRRRDLAFIDVPQLVDTEFRERPDRFKAMSEQDHRLISQIVFRVVTHDSWAIGKALDKCFIPYELDGVKRLGPPPDVQDHPGHEGENYRREWIFASQPFPVPGLTPEVKSKIKIFDLKGFSEAERRKVSGRLDLVALAEKPDDPTNFVRNFISPRLGSLFEDKILTEFLDDDDAEDLERQKIAMLDAVRAYFDDEKTENWLKPEDMGKVPCLYDAQGEWHPASKFARGAGPLLERLGLYPLHRDFADTSKWKDKTLKALQVTVNLDLKELVEAIKKMSKEAHPDRHHLGNLFGTIVTGYQPQDLTSFGDALKETDWIPVGVTGRARAADAVLPSADKRLILGESHDSYVDMDSMDLELRKRLDDLGTKAGTLAFYLGLRPNPTPEQMTEVLNTAIAKGREPPPALQTSISKALVTLSVREREEWRKGVPRPSFRWNGRWYEGPTIRILADKEGIPVPLESLGVLVLSPDEALPVQEYLTTIGASTKVETIDYVMALQWISKKARADPSSWGSLKPRYVDLWKWLDTHQNEIPSETKVRFAAERLAFVAGSWQRADDVILEDVDPSAAEVNLGPWCVLPLASGTSSAMERLGAHRISQLQEDEALRFLGALTEGTAVNQRQAEAVLKLLKTAEVKGWSGRIGNAVWPVSRSHVLRLSTRDAGEALVGNQSFLDLFPNVPQLLTSLNRRRDPDLERLALRWGARPLDDGLRYGDMTFTPTDRCTGVEAVLGEVYSRMVAFNPDDQGVLSWLHGVEVWKAKRSIQRYRLGEYEGSFTVPAVVPLGKQRMALMVRSEVKDLDAGAAQALVEYAIGEGLDPERKTGTTTALVQLYKDREEAIDYDPTVERQRPGYGDTIRKLAGWYHACQLCGEVTPKDDKGLETAENIRSMISNRGGLFEGTFDVYEPANSLYLCPRHAILLQRGLVRFGFMEHWETNKDRAIESLREAERHIPEEGTMWDINDVKVYEWNWDKATDKKRDWNTRTLKLTPAHAKAIFERLIAFVESKR
jgi:hypothetical protein